MNGRDGQDGRDGRDESFGVAYVIQQMASKVDRMADQLLGLPNKTEVAFLSARVDSFVPRAELQSHWDREAEHMAHIDEHFDTIERRIEEHAKDSREQFDEINTKLDASAANRLPAWALPILIAAVPILTTLVEHFWRSK